MARSNLVTYIGFKWENRKCDSDGFFGCDLEFGLYEGFSEIMLTFLITLQCYVAW